MARRAALFGSVFACLVLATSAAPGTYYKGHRGSDVAYEVALRVFRTPTRHSWLAALTRTKLVLPQDVQDIQQDQSQNCQLCLAAVTVGEGFLIGSGEVQDLVSLSLEATSECSGLLVVYTPCVQIWLCCR